MIYPKYNIRAKVFATQDKRLLLICVCDILNAVLYFARHFAFCVYFLDLGVKFFLKKRQRFENVCKQLK